MPTRTARLTLAASLALGFVLFRILYAFIFSGLGGTQLLLDVPSYRLAGPFRSVEILGPITLDGIWRNVSLAIPFAATILIFGVLAAFFDPARLGAFGKRFPKLGWLTTTIAIGLSSIPLLAANARELNNFRKLRGESRLAIIAPLFERTVATAMTTALQISRSQPDSHASGGLSVSNLQIGEFGPIGLSLKSGELMLLSGATGAGKSTLLRALAGEAFEDDARRVSGEIYIGKEQVTDFASGSRLAYFVPQLPQGKFLGEMVEDAGPFTAGLVGKSVANLSHGEAYRLALDTALRRSPRLLLLDEPAAALDANGMELLVEQLELLTAAGTTVVVAEHRTERLAPIATQVWQISDRGLVSGVFKPESIEPIRTPALTDRSQSSVLVTFASGKPIAGIELHLGECVAIVGDNGAGKSTMLRQIAASDSACTAVFGLEVRSFNPSSVALVPDRPAGFFVTDSLGAELRRADRVAKATPGLTRLTLESVLGESVEGWLSTHPLDLSTGTQLALAVAMQLAHKPQLLLIDEPVQGLDLKARNLMAETIRCVQETGCAVIMATHDFEFASLLASRTFELNNQVLRTLKAGSQA
jgi:energy-coupling factor transporter ATP-binding protein EcfA2